MVEGALLLKLMIATLCRKFPPALAILFLGLFLGAEPEAFASTNISAGILEWRFRDTPPALRTLVEETFLSTLTERGYDLIPTATLLAQLHQANVPLDCSIGPCLTALNRVRPIDLVVLPALASLGSSYDVTLTVIEAGQGTVIHQTLKRCDVCNFSDVRQTVVEATHAIHRAISAYWAANGWIVVETPPQAELLVDGISVGTTPTKRLVSAGTHRLALKQGDRYGEMHVVVIAGQTQRVELSLTTMPLRSSGSTERSWNRDRRYISWIVLASGILLTYAGSLLLALDGHCPYAVSERCERWETTTPGLALTTIGVASLSASALLFWKQRTSAQPQTDVGFITTRNQFGVSFVHRY